MCRKQSGHILAAVNVRRDALSVGGEQHVRWYRSSDKVERGFRSKCLFDGPTGLHLSKHTFVGEKGDYYEIADGLPQSDSY